MSANVQSLTFAQNYAALLHNWRREFTAARLQAEAVIAASSKHHLPQELGMGIICRDIALVGLGQQAEGIAQLHASLAAWNATGARLHCTAWLGFLAEARFRAGQLDDALCALNEAAETAMVTGESHFKAELERLRGEVLRKTEDAAEAASWFRRALDTARSQQAKSLELRAAISLARLWRDQGERSKAHDLLAPGLRLVHRGFRYCRSEERQGAAR
jgi:predicted ATPase